jgi:hypothetical protein
MTVARSLTSSEAKIRAALLAVLHAAPRPLSFRQIKTTYAGPDASDDLLRALLREVVTAGAAFPCGTDRYWHRDEKALHVETARTLIAERPRTKSELVRALGDLDTGVSEAWREQLVDELKDHPDIHLLPVLGNARSYRLSFKPARLDDYIDRARAEYRKAHAALTAAGYGDADILRAICGLKAASASAAAPADPAAPERPKPLLPARDEDDLDFQRDAAELIVYAWQDTTSEEARAILEDTLFSLGLDPVGKPGDVTAFDGRIQHCTARLDPGQPVRVTRCGWELRNARGHHLVAKARVEPAPSAS